MDAVGEDAVANVAAGLEQAFDVAVQLVDVALVRCTVVEDVGFELDTGVVNVQVHPTGVADSGRPFGRHV